MQSSSQHNKIFCFNPQNENTLVMLSQPQHIVSKMVNVQNQLNFVLVMQNANINTNTNTNTNIKMNMKMNMNVEELQDRLKLFEEDTGSIVRVVDGVDGVGEFLEKNRDIRGVKLVCHQGLIQHVQYLNRWKQISVVIQYPGTLDKQDYAQPAPNTKGYDILKGGTTLQQLLKIMKNCCETEPEYRQLMNFVSLKGDIWKSNVLVSTMMAMVNQQLDPSTRGQILDYLSDLAHLIQGSNLFGELFDQMRQGQLSVERVFYWYTNSIGFYKIMNNLLRSSTHPSQAYYIQPFFIDLFSAIQKLQSNSQTKTFTCYRGGSLYQQQIQQLKNNVGHLVKNLSFLSTSLNLETAQYFTKNAIFEIYVDDFKGQLEFKYDYGYANIKKYSYFYEEEEIVFNPLSSFKVLEVKEYQSDEDNKTNYVVILEYGSLTKTMSKIKDLGQDALNENQRFLCTLGKRWELECETKLQGEILINENVVFEDQCCFWEKYVQIAKNPMNKCQGLVNWGISEENKGNDPLSYFSQAQIIFKDCLKHLKIEQFSRQAMQQGRISKKLIETHYQIQISLARSYFAKGNYQKSQQICTQQCESVLEVFGESHPAGIKFMLISGRIAWSIGKQAQSQQLYQKISQILIKKGEINLSYIDYLFNLINILIIQGKYQQSQKYALKCNQWLLANFGETHHDYLKSLNILAGTCNSLGQHERAKEILEQWSKLAKNSVDRKHYYYHDAVANMARTYQQLQDYKKAQAYFFQYFQLRNSTQSSSSKIDIKYLQCLNSFAFNYACQQQKQPQLQLRRIAYQIGSDLLDEKHLVHLQSAVYLGCALMEVGKYEEARLILERCCWLLGEKREEGLPMDFQEIKCSNCLAYVWYKLGDANKSIQLLDKCQQMFETGLIKKDHSYLDILRTQSLLLSNHPNPPRSATLTQKCLTLHPPPLPSNKVTAYTYRLQQLGHTFCQQRRYLLAEHLYEKCCEIFGNVFGECGDYYWCLGNLVWVNLRLGKFQKSLQIQQKILNHSLTFRNFNCMVGLLINLGEYWVVVEKSWEFLGLGQMGQGTGRGKGKRQGTRKEIANFLKNFAYIHQNLSQLNKALQLLKIYFKIAQRIHGEKKQKKTKQELRMREKVRGKIGRAGGIRRCFGDFMVMQ